MVGAIVPPSSMFLSAVDKLCLLKFSIHFQVELSNSEKKKLRATIESSELIEGNYACKVTWNATTVLIEKVEIIKYGRY